MSPVFTANMELRDACRLSRKYIIDCLMMAFRKFRERIFDIIVTTFRGQAP